MCKRWSEDDACYLRENWGTVSIPGIAKKLNRSIGSIKEKAYKLGLGAHLDGGANVTYNQFIKAAGIESGDYTKKRLIANGFPVHRQKCINCSFLTVNIDEFWKWAENHKEMIDFSRIEKNIFGKEPKWVDEARKASYNDPSKRKKRKWTKAEDARLEMLLKRNIYTYKELSRELGRSESAVKRRIWDLALPYKPIRKANKDWQEAEVELLLKMRAAGNSWEEIGEKVGRTGLAVRGKYEMLCNPNYQICYRAKQPYGEEWQSVGNSGKAAEKYSEMIKCKKV